MPGLYEFLVGSVPIAGGAVLGAVAGNIAGGVKNPDARSLINQDLDLIDRLPAEETDRRAAVLRTVNARVDELVAGFERKTSVRKAAISYQGNWRDIVVLVCAIMLTIAWWNEDHARTYWLPTLVLLFVLCGLSFGYAARGVTRAVSTYRHDHAFTDRAANQRKQSVE